MPPTKDEVLATIRAAYNDRQPLRFNMATLPASVNVDDIALEIKTLTGKDIGGNLYKAHQAKEALNFPFDKIAKSTQTAVDVSNAPVTSPDAMQQGTAQPEEPEEPNPSMGERFSAGLRRQEIPQPKGLDIGDIAQGAGEYAGPTIGAGIGAMSAAPTWLPTGMSSAFAGGMAGAAAGRAVQTAAMSKGDESVSNLMLDPVLAALEQGLGEGLLNKITGKTFGGIKALGKNGPHGRTPSGQFASKGKRQLSRFEDAGASWLKSGPGIEAESAEAVMKDPEILWRAGPLKEVEKEYGKWMGKLGSREERAIELIGDDTPSFAKIKGFLKTIEETMQVGHGKGTEQYLKGLLTAREQIARQLEIGKLGDPTQASLRRYWLAKRGMLDKAIEKERPGYARVRKMYNEALINKSFNNLMPLDPTGHPNIGKAGAALGAATTALAGSNYIGNPALAAPVILGAIGVSPIAAKGALLGMAALSRTLRLAHAAQLPQSAMAILYNEALKKAGDSEAKQKIKKLILDRAREAKVNATIAPVESSQPSTYKPAEQKEAPKSDEEFLMELDSIENDPLGVLKNLENDDELF